MSNNLDRQNLAEPIMSIQLLRGEEVAKLLRISRAFAYQLMRRGEIPTVRMGRSVRVRRQDLERFISANLEGISDPLQSHSKISEDEIQWTP